MTTGKASSFLVLGAEKKRGFIAIAFAYLVAINAALARWAAFVALCERLV